MVAKGKVHNTLGEVLHHQPLPAGYLKVLIDISLEGGAYVAWSSSLSIGRAFGHIFE